VVDEVQEGRGGADGLRPRKHAGKPPALDEEQRRELVEVL
jgi:transposase